MNKQLARIVALVLAVVAIVPLTKLTRKRATEKQTTNVTLIIPNSKGIRVTDSFGVTHNYPSALSAVRVSTTIASGNVVWGLNIYSGANGTGYLMGYYEDGHWQGVSIASSENIGQ